MFSQLQHHKFWFVCILWLENNVLKDSRKQENPRQKYELASMPGHMVTLLLLTKTSCYHAYSYYFTNYWQNWEAWNRYVMAIQPSICKLLHKMSLNTYMCNTDTEVEKNIYILWLQIILIYFELPVLQFFTVRLQTSWYTPHISGSYDCYFWHCNDIETLL
jgi:hypothetical protein